MSINWKNNPTNPTFESIITDDIYSETSAGVTIHDDLTTVDGIIVGGSIVVADDLTVNTDATIVGDLQVDTTLTVDTINENTTNSGVTIEGVVLENSGITFPGSSQVALTGYISDTFVVQMEETDGTDSGVLTLTSRRIGGIVVMNYSYTHGTNTGLYYGQSESNLASRVRPSVPVVFFNKITPDALGNIYFQVFIDTDGFVRIRKVTSVGGTSNFTSGQVVTGAISYITTNAF
jgi:hypothetical protein